MGGLVVHFLGGVKGAVALTFLLYDCKVVKTGREQGTRSLTARVTRRWGPRPACFGGWSERVFRMTARRCDNLPRSRGLDTVLWRFSAR